MAETGPADTRTETLVVPGTDACAVKLPIFEGPLDLLLHLIRMNEVDVTDIPIASIAEQYVEYVALMRDLNLDVAGEYLVMAATLAWIKSRMLLPVSEDDAEDDGIDPRAELVARLLEYQRFKEVAGELGERQMLGRDVFAPPGLEPEVSPEGEREIDVGIVALLEAFRRVVRTARASQTVHEVEVETITVRERMLHLMDLLTRAEAMTFEQVFEDLGGPPSRHMLVASFLALLELTRLGAVRIYQGLGDDEAPEGPIRLRRVADLSDADWSERIAEIM